MARVLMALTNAEKKRAQRARAKAAGRCTECYKRKARIGKTKCQQCNDRTKLGVYRSRGHEA